MRDISELEVLAIGISVGGGGYLILDAAKAVR